MPAGSVGGIIGPKGSTINEIQRQSNCNIAVDKNSVDGPERTITVSGFLGDTGKAVELVNSRVEDWRRNEGGAHMQASFPFNGSHLFAAPYASPHQADPFHTGIAQLQPQAPHGPPQTFRSSHISGPVNTVSVGSYSGSSVYQSKQRY